MNISLLSNILLKWFYDEPDVLIALADMPGKSCDFPGGAVYRFYTPKMHAVKESFDKFLTQNRAEYAINTNGTLIISGLQGSLTETYVLFKHTDEAKNILLENHDYVYDKYMLTRNPKNIKKYESEKKPPPELPIPSHLKNILIPNKQKSTHLKVIGELRCACENTVFYVKTLVEDGVTDGSYIKTVCNKCGYEYLIFDSRAHGWDGYIGRDLDERLLDAQAKVFCCGKCNSNRFNLKITISSQGREDFVSELKDEIDKGLFAKEDWVNAFEWIKIDITCLGCGKKYPNFIDFETM